MNQFDLILLGGATVSGLMFALWLAHFPLKNAAIVDFGWALGTGLLGGLYAVLGPGWTVRAALIGAMSGVWGLDRKSTRLNSSHSQQSRMPSSA